MQPSWAYRTGWGDYRRNVGLEKPSLPRPLAVYNVREPVTVLGRSGTAERARFTVLRQGGDIFRLEVLGISGLGFSVGLSFIDEKSIPERDWRGRLLATYIEGPEEIRRERRPDLLGIIVCRCFCSSSDSCSGSPKARELVLVSMTSTVASSSVSSI